MDEQQEPSEDNAGSPESNGSAEPAESTQPDLIETEPATYAQTVREKWRHTAATIDDPAATLKSERPTIAERDILPMEGSGLAPPIEEMLDYTLLDVIGEGGMGVVYRVHQKSLDRDVALKKIKDFRSRQKQETFQQHFITEAVVTGNLDHPNIVPVYSLERDTGGGTFYTMKRVVGRPWNECMAQMSLQENLDVLLRVCDAVAYAHSQDIIHRDLKPQNVMLGDFGEVLLMDWGLAASLGSAGKAENIRTTAHLGGTPCYMAPEQARHLCDQIGKRTDVYLLGGILFTIITGEMPHSAETVMKCITSAAENRIPQVPDGGELAQIAYKAMSTDPQDRQQSVVAFQEDVRHYQEHIHSIALAHDAQRLLDEAESDDDYDRFARSVFAFQEALTLWSENEEAARGLAAAREAYAEAAYRGGDYDLALSVLAQEPPSQLKDRISIALQQRQRREHIVRSLKIGVIALSLLVILGLTVGFFWIRSERQKAEYQRDKALQEGYFAKIRLAAVKIQERQFDKALHLLDTSPAGLRGWEWGFLKHRCNLDALTFRGHSAQVEALAVAPDGNTIASADWTGAIKLWNPDSGRETLSIAAHDGIIADLAFSPDGAALASAGDDAKVKLWNIATGEPIASLQGHSGEVWSVGWSPNGKMLASAGMDGRLIIRDAATREEAATIVSPSGGVTAFAFGPDGRIALAYGELERPASVCVLRPPDLSEEFTVAPHKKHVNCLAFSPDGALLASGSWDGDVAVLDANTGKSLRYLHHDGPVFGLAFSPDGARLATASEDRSVKLWNTRHWRLLNTFAGHSGPVSSVRFLPDGERFASASIDGTVKLWDPQLIAQDAAPLATHSAVVTSVAFSPHGDLVASADEDGLVLLTRPDQPKDVAVLDAGHGASYCVAFSSDGLTLACGYEDGSLALWDVASRIPAVRVSAHQDVIRSVAFSPDGKIIASGGWDGSVKLWDAEPGEPPRTLSEAGAKVQCVAFCPDGRRVAVARRDGHVYIYDVTGEDGPVVLPGHSGWARAVAFSPDGGLIASAGDDNLVKVWDARSYALLTALKGHSQWVKAVAFSPDGARLVSADDAGALKLWDPRAGRELLSWQAHSDVIWSVSFSPDGLAIGSAGADRLVHIWRALPWGGPKKQ